MKTPKIKITESQMKLAFQKLAQSSLLKEELSKEEYENLKNLIKAGGDNYEIAKEIAATEGIDIKEIIQEIIDDLGFDVNEISIGFFEYAIWVNEDVLIEEITEIQGEDFDSGTILNVHNFDLQSKKKLDELIMQFFLQLPPDALLELGDIPSTELGYIIAKSILLNEAFGADTTISDKVSFAADRVLSQRAFWLQGIYVGDDLQLHLM